MPIFKRREGFTATEMILVIGALSLVIVMLFKTSIQDLLAETRVATSVERIKSLFQGAVSYKAQTDKWSYDFLQDGDVLLKRKIVRIEDMTNNWGGPNIMLPAPGNPRKLMIISEGIPEMRYCDKMKSLIDATFGKEVSLTECGKSQVKGVKLSVAFAEK